MTSLQLTYIGYLERVQMYNNVISNNIWLPVYEGGKDPANKEPKEPKEEETYTKEDLQKAVQDEVKKNQAKMQGYIDELSALKSLKDLTTSDREEMEAKLQELNNQLMTKEELAEQAKTKLRKEADTKINELESKLNNIQSRYQEETVNRAIIEEAVAGEAFSPEQIIALLQPKTKLVDVLDSTGKTTGETKPRVAFNSVDKDGKPVTLDLSIKEAVELMRETDKYLNLFKGKGAGGLGALSRPSGKDIDLAELAKDPKAYREARKKGEISFRSK